VLAPSTWGGLRFQFLGASTNTTSEAGSTRPGPARPVIGHVLTSYLVSPHSPIYRGVLPESEPANGVALENSSFGTPSARLRRPVFTSLSVFTNSGQSKACREGRGAGAGSLKESQVRSRTNSSSGSVGMHRPETALLCCTHSRQSARGTSTASPAQKVGPGDRRLGPASSRHQLRALPIALDTQGWKSTTSLRPRARSAPGSARDAHRRPRCHKRPVWLSQIRVTL
jgi:hypothetical protein